MTSNPFLVGFSQDPASQGYRQFYRKTLTTAPDGAELVEVRNGDGRLVCHHIVVGSMISIFRKHDLAAAYRALDMEMPDDAEPVRNPPRKQRKDRQGHRKNFSPANHAKKQMQKAAEAAAPASKPSEAKAKKSQPPQKLVKKPVGVKLGDFASLGEYFKLPAAA